MRKSRPTEARWELYDGVIQAADGTVVCHLSDDGSVQEGAGGLIAAAPQLAAALRASIEVLQEVAIHIPPHSAADIAAARAVTLAFEALEAAGSEYAWRGE